MTSISNTKPSWIAYSIFLIGILFAIVAWIIWLDYVGVSWWYAYEHGATIGPAADRARDMLCGIGVLICMIAPLFGTARLSRKLLLCCLGAFAGLGAAYLCGLVMLLFVGV
jgi:hypothetical protein